MDALLHAELAKLLPLVDQEGSSRVADVATRVAFAPYRICPLGAHIDHQGGPVLAAAINMGVRLAYRPIAPQQLVVRSLQFKGTVRFKFSPSSPPSRRQHGDRVNTGEGRREEQQRYGDRGNTGGGRGASSRGGEEGGGEKQQQKQEQQHQQEHEEHEEHEEHCWGNYVRGAVWALLEAGYSVNQGLVGVIAGEEGVDSGGISSSAATGVAFLLALADANSLNLSSAVLIELDRRLENVFLGLRNGVLDQSAVVLSRANHITLIRCQTRSHDDRRVQQTSGGVRGSCQEASGGIRHRTGPLAHPL